MFHIVKQSWSKLKKLLIHPHDFGLKPIGHSYSEINDNVFKKDLIRHGKYLKEIDLAMNLVT